MLEKIWFIGFARITNKKQAEKVAHVCAYLYGILIFLMAIRGLYVGSLRTLGDSIFAISFNLSALLGIYALIGVALYAKSRLVSLLGLFYVISKLLLDGMDNISYMLATEHTVYFLGIFAGIFITVRATYASFKFHQFQPKETYA